MTSAGSTRTRTVRTGCPVLYQLSYGDVEYINTDKNGTQSFWFRSEVPRLRSAYIRFRQNTTLASPVVRNLDVTFSTYRTWDMSALVKKMLRFPY